MDEKLKRLLELLKNDPDYEIKFVHYWNEIGTVDSLLYDTYEDATREPSNYITSIPVIVERDKS